jgi:hypothetical protein
MWHKLVTCSLTLLAAVVLTAPGPGGSILIDDFSDRTDDEWIHEDFTPMQRATFDASSGAYVLDSNAFVPITDPNVGFVDAVWKGSVDQPRFANGQVRAMIRANTAGTTAGIHFRANEETGTDYGFYGSTSFGTFYIERFDQNGQTIIAMADPAQFPFVPGAVWNLEGTILGQQISLKAWPLGARKPSEPQLRVMDKGLDPRSGTEICVLVFFDPAPLGQQGVTAVRVSGTFDNIYYSPGDQR